MKVLIKLILLLLGLNSLLSSSLTAQGRHEIGFTSFRLVEQYQGYAFEFRPSVRYTYRGKHLGLRTTFAWENDNNSTSASAYSWGGRDTSQFFSVGLQAHLNAKGIQLYGFLDLGPVRRTYSSYSSNGHLRTASNSSGSQKGYFTQLGAGLKIRVYKIFIIGLELNWQHQRTHTEGSWTKYEFYSGPGPAGTLLDSGEIDEIRNANAFFSSGIILALRF